MKRQVRQAAFTWGFILLGVVPLLAGPRNSLSNGIVINEIMQDPKAVSDTKGEWIELYNPSEADVDINGWTIRDDGSNIHVIDAGGPLIIPARGYTVLGRSVNQEENGGAPVDYEYDDFSLGNSDDEVILLDADSSEVDRVVYDGGPEFPDPAGASMELNSPELDNNVGANWHTASIPYGDGDFGTPGAHNSIPLTVTTTELPNCIVGLDYKVTLFAEGGVPPYSWRLASGSLPDGLTLDAEGIISGVPAVVDTQTFTVEVEDDVGNKEEKEFSLVVTEQEFERGDVNGDGSINVLDVMATVNHILDIQPLVGVELTCADCNADTVVNILDTLGIVNVILGIGECAPA